MKTNKLPSWGEHLFNTRRVVVVEETVTDPKTMTMVTYTRNVNLRFFMGTTERVTFRPHNNVVNDSNSNNNNTEAFKEVWIESDVYGLRSAIKRFGLDRFKKNCVKATEGFEWVLSGGREAASVNRKQVTSSSASTEPIVTSSPLSQ